MCAYYSYSNRRYRIVCRVILESVAPESIDVVVVVDDDIPMYTHSVSLATLLFDFEFSSSPARDAT